MRFLRKNDVAALVGWHPVHVMREARAGRFPKPVQIGRNSVGFVAEEVDVWMAARVAERDDLDGPLIDATNLHKAAPQ